MAFMKCELFAPCFSVGMSTLVILARVETIKETVAFETLPRVVVAVSKNVVLKIFSILLQKLVTNRALMGVHSRRVTATHRLSTVMLQEVVEVRFKRRVRFSAF